MEKLKIVTALRSGPGWIPEYVYNFKKGVDRHVTVPYEFVCISDINLNIPTLQMNSIGQGFWCKLQLFRPELKLTGPCLFFDLDTIIVNNIDSMIQEMSNHKFLMMEDFWMPGSSSSAMMWWNGDYSHLWKTYLSKPEKFWNKEYRPKKRYGDQAFIMEHVEHSLIQRHINNPDSIRKYTPEADRDNVNVWIFGAKRTKPWMNLDDSLVIDHWAN